MTILHVVPAFDVVAEPLVRFDDSGRLLSPASDDEVVAERRRWIDPATAALEPTLLVQGGRAADAIVSCAASLAADLLVLGTHGPAASSVRCWGRSRRRCWTWRRARS